MTRDSKIESKYKRRVAKKPSDIHGWIALGYYYLYIQEFDKSRNAFKRATELDVKQFEAWCGLGESLLNLERFTEARDAFSICTHLQPRYHRLGLLL